MSVGVFTLYHVYDLFCFCIYSHSQAQYFYLLVRSTTKDLKKYTAVKTILNPDVQDICRNKVANFSLSSHDGCINVVKSLHYVIVIRAYNISQWLLFVEGTEYHFLG